MNIQDRYRAFFLAKLTSRTDVGGVWHYAWYEQIFDPLTGTPTDANPGRTGTATISPALEANNAALDFTSGPIYAFIKQKGIVNGQVTYEFVASGSSGTIFTGSAPEYRTRCLNGYVILERATISLNGSGLSQTDYVFEKSLGTRCFETSGSGASGSGSGSGGSGGNTPNPPVTSQTIAVVTNVCPIYEGGSGSGSGGFMTGITVEKVLLTLPPGTVVRPVTCVENPNDCCSGSGLVGDCCAGLTPQESTPWGMIGSFGPSGTEGIVSGVAERTDPTGLYYTDVLPAETGTSYATFNMYCSDGQWIASGVVSLSALDGAVLNYNVPLELVDGLLVGEIETPDDLGVITVVAYPPCGGSNPEGCLSCEPCGPVSARWVASFESFAVTLFIDPGATDCYFQSSDGDWVLKFVTAENLWRLTGTESRSWVLGAEGWNCCIPNVMISEQEEPDYTLTPSINCCPEVRYDCTDGECVESAEGEFATLGECQAACGDFPACATLPSVLVVTPTVVANPLANTSPFNITFTSDAHWYGLPPTLPSCNPDEGFNLHCNPPTYGDSLYSGSTLVLIAQTPTSLTFEVTVSGFACVTVGDRFVVSIP